MTSLPFRVSLGGESSNKYSFDKSEALTSGENKYPRLKGLCEIKWDRMYSYWFSLLTLLSYWYY